MRVLHVLATPRAEGVPNLLLDWLGIEGIEQEVFVLHNAPPDLEAELRRLAHWYGDDDLFARRGPWKFLRTVMAIRRVCGNRRPDLLICWFTGFAPWVCVGARLGGGRQLRLLVHCGNPPTTGWRADLLACLQMIPAWFVGTRAICCSDYVRDLYRRIPGLPQAMFCTVYNCIRAKAIRTRAGLARAARDETAPGASRPVVGIMVATLEAHKDHATLLHALPEVLAARPDFRLWLVGDGSLRASLEALAARLSLGSAVAFLGSRRDVPELLGQADLFVFSTTRQEGLGSVLLEALAAGLPVVASDCPACREVLADGRFGVLVSSGDSAALAQAILRLLGEKSDWNAEPEITYAESFTPERMLRAYLQAARLSP